MFPLLLLLVGGDVDRLGSHDWNEREWAEIRLRLRGQSAWSELLKGLESEDAEVRARLDRLLRSYRDMKAEERVTAVLMDYEPPSPWAFYADSQLRLRLHRRLEILGRPQYQTDAIHPEWNPWFQMWGVPSWWTTQCQLLKARRWVQGWDGFPW